ncbi:hypothetical protein GOBAR_AA38663 [Gossypium barbadense]|uniref:Uncharacterized protein n=1 Tax=Gossypium barbadense TaxID=3634 RepID=A0A2P5VT90_GOSBA|nr:hypothetical protein GOBAR_AA38663 [Gossypium barbadense]
MGGLGKTTLAKKIYHHSQVVGHFKHLVCVYVSEHCQKRKVWEDILSGLHILSDEDRKMNVEKLAKKLSSFFEDNKCLVILDDVWNIDAWNSLKPAFSARETKSKILLTSRNKEIVSHADKNGFLYELQYLNYDQSWELFQKIAFPQTNSPGYKIDAKMKELGEGMVKHCAGLPLAIIILGGILATKYPSLNEWLKVSINVKSYFKIDKGQVLKDMLALSYDDLPPFLRPCFLYLSQFPEDYEIPVDRLIQLWIAEGIVSSKQEEGLIAEDVAESYLIELAERCMIQAKEEKFFDIADQSNACQLSRIGRSLRLRRKRRGRMQVTQYIGKLIHLRFLRLRGLEFFTSKLPSSLGNLRFLQTLDLRIKNICRRSIHVPNLLWRMQQLRHLYLPEECSLKTKLKLGTLKNLQTLVNFNTKNCYVKDLINMENLRELQIRGPFNIEDFNTEELDKNPPIIQIEHRCGDKKVTRVPLPVFKSCLHKVEKVQA